MKKIFTVILTIAILVANLSILTSAAVATKIKDINPDGFLPDAQSVAEAYSRLNGEKLGSKTIENLTISAKDELRVYLNAAMFLDTNNKVFGTSAQGVTLSQLQDGKITVVTKKRTGSSILKSISLAFENKSVSVGDLVAPKGSAYIKIQFVDNFVSTSDLDFSFSLGLRVKGASRTATDFVVSGTMQNPKEVADAYTNSIDISDGTVIEANGFVKNITLEMGEGFYMTTTLYEGRKYYGTAKIESNQITDQVITKLPSLEMVYVIRQVNLSTKQKVCRFDISPTLYVYNDKFEYLGTTKEVLPFSSIYYLTSKKK